MTSDAKWLDYWWGTETQMTSHVVSAASMVWSLPELASEVSTLPAVARQACLEAFLVNVRLLTEFLIRGVRAKNDKDFSATDIPPDWTPEPGSTA